MRTDSVLDALLAHTGAPVHYLAHDLHFLREERRHAVDGDSPALTEAAEYRRLELGLFDRVDSILTFSEDEAAVIRSVRPDAVVRAAPLFFYNRPDSDAREPAGCALLDDTPEALAAAIVRLWQDDALWRRLSAGGLQVIVERFSEAAAESLLRTLLCLEAA